MSITLLLLFCTMLQHSAPRSYLPSRPLTWQLGISLDVDDGINDGPHRAAMQQGASSSGRPAGDLSHCCCCVPLQLLVGIVQAEEETRDAVRGGHVLQGETEEREGGGRKVYERDVQGR